MLATHQDAERRYSDLRRVALDAAQAGAPKGLRYDTVTPSALSAAKQWMSASQRQVDWDWRDPVGLAALSMGRPTYQGSHLRLDFLEARPKELGAREPILADVLVAYSIYARMLSADEIRIMHPINERVRLHYQAFGYVYVAKQDYLFKQVI
jgi:hypothetical protein